MPDLALEQFEAFKRLYPSLRYLQEIQPSHARSLHEQTPIDWNTVVPVDFRRDLRERRDLKEMSLDSCEARVAMIVLDAVAFAVGAVSVRINFRSATLRAISEAIATVRQPISIIIGEMAHAAARFSDKAYAFFRILQTLAQKGVLKAVWDAFLGNLTWFDAVLYGIAGVATLVAAFGSGGIALAAEIALLIVSAYFLANDIAEAVKKCSISESPIQLAPVLTADGMPIKSSVAIRTVTGNYLTVVENGGFAAPNSTSPIATDRRKVGPWEEFELVPIDHVKKTFALRTHSGHYFSATLGGGLGGPNNATSPIHTDTRNLDRNEKLTVITLPNKKVAIATSSGFYVTAIGGGGMTGPDDASSIIHTDKTQIGPWETFTFDQLDYSEKPW